MDTNIRLKTQKARLRLMRPNNARRLWVCVSPEGDSGDCAVGPTPAIAMKYYFSMMRVTLQLKEAAK